MPQPESWLTIIKTLPNPLQTWLSKSYLTQLTDKSCVLFVDNSTRLIIDNLSYLSQIYPVVKKLHNDVTSLYISGSTVSYLLSEKKLEIFTVEDYHANY